MFRCEAAAADGLNAADFATLCTLERQSSGKLSDTYPKIAVPSTTIDEIREIVAATTNAKNITSVPADNSTNDAAAAETACIKKIQKRRVQSTVGKVAQRQKSGSTKKSTNIQATNRQPAAKPSSSRIHRSSTRTRRTGHDILWPARATRKQRSKPREICGNSKAN
uniref:Variant surface glycoprotein n=1 Tax=Trypanosoma brucei TaxID=5691 RepID=A0A1V0FYY4_9TRYP|nr:variant surface glycoprotein [Trypanosoma brucei]